MVQNTQQKRVFDEQMEKRRLVRKLGITQIVIAILCIILGIFGTIFINKHNMNAPTSYYRELNDYHYYPITGAGIWSSVFTVIAGGIGIGIGSPSSGKGLMMVHIVFAIISCVLELCGFLSSLIVLLMASFKAEHTNISLRLVYVGLCIFLIINFFLMFTALALCRNLRKNSRSVSLVIYFYFLLDSYIVINSLLIKFV